MSIKRQFVGFRAWCMKMAFVIAVLGVIGGGVHGQVFPFTWEIGSPNPSAVIATLYADSTLTISGTGAVMNWNRAADRPWHHELTRRYLKTVVIDSGVTTIGNHAFNSCQNLTSITIPNSVVSIGDVALRYTSLTSITIPNSVTTIGDGAFASASITSIEVVPDNQNFTSEDGVLFNKDKTALIKYPQGKQDAYTIPNSVVTIESGAFSESGLTSIIIPSSVTMIGEAAFYGCRDLTSIISLNPIPPATTGYGVFSGTNMTCLYVPQNGIAVYSASNNWNWFSHCIKPLYTVTFNSQGGSAVGSQAAIPDGTIAKPTDPARLDHIFEGWYKDPTGISAWDFDADVVTSDITLFARWQRELIPVTDITDIPANLGVPALFQLEGTVVPANTTHKTIVWSIEDAGTTNANILNNALFASTTGEVLLKAVVVNGKGEGQDFEKTFTITINSTSSAQSPDRILPPTGPDVETAVVAPVGALSGKFTIGPNPVSRAAGTISFYWQGGALSGGTLFIYNACGNVVNRIVIDGTRTANTHRQIGAWDLTDKRGNPVLGGTYLIRGILTGVDGKRERVSVMLGIR